MSIDKNLDINCVWAGHNILGEGPIWDFREQVLFWIDIEQAQLHRFNPQTEQHVLWQLPSKPGSIALRKQGGLLLALRKEIAIITFPEEKLEILSKPLQEFDNLKFNDGGCDRQGRFWVGSADIAEQNPIGSLYCFTGDQHLKIMDSGFIVANGLAWNHDNSIMYFTDSPARTIYQYDFDLASGQISNRRIFVQIPEDAGFPDGLTVDADDHVWSAHWNGWRITRYQPDGKIDRVIDMPVQCPTSCCFGGENFDILYVTSASRDLTAEEYARGPLAGNLFALQVGIRGCKETMFAS